MDIPDSRIWKTIAEGSPRIERFFQPSERACKFRRSMEGLLLKCTNLTV